MRAEQRWLLFVENRASNTQKKDQRGWSWLLLNNSRRVLQGTT
ncbi:hypothetical protein GCHA_2101 [Paraglaciecola chathamensis S18K6]|uniref:Uncharacterized protein n=1 Tax=Paraglaciecola chathamensis S18K6 TaxID=1127672 RepID=A0AAV3UZE8_9ALTE|nr:hypothetical protein GCHA_2101 [Paraglaciecola chathamensis S18K6]